MTILLSELWLHHNSRERKLEEKTRRKEGWWRQGDGDKWKRNSVQSVFPVLSEIVAMS